jgi:hypothetical protein
VPSCVEQLGKDREAGVAEMLGDHLHLDRVAQVGLVGAVPEHRLAVGDLRPVAGVDGAPPPNSSNTPAITGSIVAKTSSWVTKLISMSSW